MLLQAPQQLLSRHEQHHGVGSVSLLGELVAKEALPLTDNLRGRIQPGLELKLLIDRPSQ